jgi:7,8-dihydro-6-hydroxymethylpterin-pyrophosphokinase
MNTNQALLFISIKVIAGTEMLKKLVAELKMISWDLTFSSVYRQFENEERYDFDANMILVARIGFNQSPGDLVEKLKHTETYLMAFTGPQKVRLVPLAINQLTTMTPQLTLPHPQLHMDPLVTRCAAEVWGSYEHPVLKKTLNDLARVAPAITDAEFMLQGKSLVTW